MGLIAESNLYVPQASDFESEFLKQIDIREMQPLNLPVVISNDIKGIINAVNHNIGINKFLLEGLPGSGKTEAAKHIARLLGRTLYCVDFEHLIDSKLGQTNKNIASIFAEINMFPYSNKRDSWRAGVSKTDKTELVTNGIYQFSRNPAFLGFDLLYIGTLLMFFNWILCILTVFAVTMYHLQIVNVEEDFLLATFGNEYLQYKKKVCRYIGRKRKISIYGGNLL